MTDRDTATSDIAAGDGSEPDEVVGDTGDIGDIGEIVEGEFVALDPSDLDIDLPDDPGDARQVLLQEVARARVMADDHLADLRRVAAEFDNYRKRTMKDRHQVIDRASQRVVESILPVLDSFDAAFTHEPQTPTEEKLVDGIRSTYHQLVDVLRKEGLEFIPAIGEPFDPEVHEAVAGPDSGDGSLVVSTELRRGYRLRGRVIRPALVAVDHA